MRSKREKKSSLQLVPLISTQPSGPPWEPPPELEFRPEALHDEIMQAVAKGELEHATLDRRYVEDERRRVEEILRAKLVLHALPAILRAAAQAGQKTADVYEVRLTADMKDMPGVCDTASAGLRPSLENLRGAARLIYKACEALDLEPAVHFYYHPRGDKGGYMIRVSVPSFFAP